MIAYHIVKIIYCCTLTVLQKMPYNNLKGVISLGIYVLNTLEVVGSTYVPL